jgi:hypothetical protein
MIRGIPELSNYLCETQGGDLPGHAQMGTGLLETVRRTLDGGNHLPDGNFIRTDSGWTLIPMSGGRHRQLVRGHRIEADRATAYAHLELARISHTDG